MRRNQVCAPSRSKRQRQIGAAAASAESTTAAQVTAAIRLQRVWRRAFAHLLTRQFAAEILKPGSGVSSENVKSISFEALVIFLREKPTIAVAKRCLQRIHLLSTFRHGSPTLALAPENVNVRVFLAGFMIAFRPTHVFESMGALEQALFEAAQRLIEGFERIVKRVASAGSFQAVPRDFTGQFPTLLFEYLKRFKAWKVPDEAKLTCRIKHALIALFQAEQQLPPDEPEDSKLKVEFCTQIARLRSKLSQIAGADALAQFDAERGTGPVAGGGGGPSSSTAYAAIPGRLTNEQMAHELLLDPAFQLGDDGGTCAENPVFHRIRESFHRAFWDSLVDDLRLRPNPCYVRVLRVLAEVRDAISDLAGGAAIQEVIDVDDIRRQAELGVYEWGDCQRLVGAVVGVVRRIQAPKRDAETLEKWIEVRGGLLSGEEQPSAFCKALEFLLDRINAMRIDAANARLRLIAPVIKDHGIDYERGKFQDKLNDGSLTLERSEGWIREVVVRETALGNVALEDLVAMKPGAFVSVHTAAMLALVANPGTGTPETLLFDAGRLAQLQREFERIVDGATVLVVANNAIAGGAAQPLSREKRSVLADLAGAVVGGAGFDAADFCRGLDSAGVLTDAAARGKLLRALSACVANKKDAVRQLMAARVKTVWLEFMRTGQPTDDAKFVGSARAVLPLIVAAAGKLTALANVNRAVHLPTYNKLIAEAAHAAAK